MVEHDVPDGWEVADVNEHGAFDINNRKVKWGLFFDATPRRLSFRLLAPPSSAQELEITGLASFDGRDFNLTGNPRSAASSKLGSPQRQSNGDLDFTLTGTAGADFAIESSDDLIHWTPYKMIRNQDGLLHFQESKDQVLSQRFFRAVVIPAGGAGTP